MDTSRILTDLRAELVRINQAITALESLDNFNVQGNGGDLPSPLLKAKPIRRMSAAARKRISEAAKKRWARLRAIPKVTPAPTQKSDATTKMAKAPKKAAPARHMSAVTRRRLSQLAKARWAEKKKAAKNA